MRIIAVEPLPGHNLRVTTDDGAVHTIDVSGYVGDGEVFAPVRGSRDFFEQVYVDPIDHTVTWPNGANIDSVVLLGIKPPATALR